MDPSARFGHASGRDAKVEPTTALKALQGAPKRDEASRKGPKDTPEASRLRPPNIQTFHMNGPSGSSDLYICISEKPVGLSIHHLGHAKQINRATAKPMLFAVVGMGAKRTMPWRRNFGKANRTIMKH